MSGTEIRRFVLAVVLMMGVIIGTNLIFPPPPASDDPAAPAEGETEAEAEEERAAESRVIEGLMREEDPAEEAVAGAPDGRERLVTVETPLYRMSFTTSGGALRSVQLLHYRSFAKDGPVELVPEPPLGRPGSSAGNGRAEPWGVLDGIWVVGAGKDTVPMARYAYAATPADGFRLEEGAAPRALVFRYDHPTGRFFNEITYTFSPDSYVVQVDGRLPELDSPERTTLMLDLGPGLAVNELHEAEDRRMMAYSSNHVQDGIRSRQLSRVKESEERGGPLYWAGLKSKFFLEAVLPPGEGEFLANVGAFPGGWEYTGVVHAGVPVEPSGRYGYRAYLGPMERERLVALGNDMEEVNPYGWRLFRPIVRPFVGAVLWMMNFLHDQLLLGYGWVLVVIGVLMRILMWPFYQKSMRSQVKTMALQPHLEELKKKYANDRERMSRETMKLYKEHGASPLGGCLPLLLPWPVLIALFFVFQNTIQLRGASFLWLPDLSAPDPFYILPLFMGATMFLLQYISMRTAGTSSPQMRMMMYIMPVIMVLFFFRFASGLNLYYSVVNLATIPQQLVIAKQRKKAQAGLAKSGPAKTGRER